MTYVFHEENYRGFTIKIAQDDMPSSPREWDNLTTILLAERAQRKYGLGDDILPDTDLYEIYGKKSVIAPLYIYDHSGITISTGPFSCPWDSGQIGYVVIPEEKIKHEYGDLSDESLERAKSVLLGEVKTLDDYLTGNVMGYIVENSRGDTLDSVWGYYGELDYVLNEAKSFADYRADKVERKAVLSGPYYEFECPVCEAVTRLDKAYQYTFCEHCEAGLNLQETE